MCVSASLWAPASQFTVSSSALARRCRVYSLSASRRTAAACRAAGEAADQGVRVGEHEHDVAGVPGVDADDGHLVVAAGVVD